MVQYRGVFENSLIAHSCELLMHSISYECGNVICGCRRLSWGINGHKSKNNFINVFTCRVPQTHDIMVTMLWPHGEKIVAPYGGGSLEMCFSSLMKVRNNWANLVGLSLGYWSKRYPTESGVRFSPCWNCNISMMDSAVIVNRTF